MNASTTMTIRVPVDLKDKLGRLARGTRRSKSFLAAEAVSAYVERELEIINGIERGLEDIAAGRVVPHDEVTADARVSGPLGLVGVEVSKGQRFAVLDERNGRILVAGNAGVIPVRGWIAADKVVVREMVATESDRDAAAERVGANVGRLRDAVLEVLDKVD